jgi:hypothetical protein
MRGRRSSVATQSAEARFTAVKRSTLAAGHAQRVKIPTWNIDQLGCGATRAPSLAMEPDTNTLTAPPQFERRRHPRYRLVERVFIRRSDGSSYQATTCEISISGLSASSTVVLQPGEEVHLSPVAGEYINAIVRRKIGTVYGFEFTSVPPNIEAELHKICRGLLPFRSSAET